MWIGLKMRQVSNKTKTLILRIAKYIIGAGLSILFIGLSGSFYHATEQVVMVNLLFWSALFIVVYLLSFGIVKVFGVFLKTSVMFLDGILLLIEILAVIIFTLCLVKTPDDSLFLVIVFSVVGGVAGLAQLFYELNKRSTTKKDNGN